MFADRLSDGPVPSLFHTKIFPEIHDLILRSLPLIEIIKSAAMVNKQWHRAATQNENTRETITFSDIVLEETEAADYLNKQWKEFVSFVEEQNYSPLKTSRTLLKAHKVFLAGIDVEIEERNEVAPEMSLTDWFSQHQDSFFDDLLSHQDVRDALEKEHEIRELFLISQQGSENVIYNFLKYRATGSKNNDMPFLKYLINKYSPFLTDGEIMKVIHHLAKKGDSESHRAYLHFFLKKLSKIHDDEKIAALTS